MARRAVVALATFGLASALFATASPAVTRPPSVHMAITSLDTPTTSDTAVRKPLNGVGLDVLLAHEAEVSPTVSLTAAAGSATESGPTAATATPAVEHVVVVSIDGLNPRSISELGPAGAPTFDELLIQGVSTLNARTTVEQTTTLPNHASMVSGRKVSTPGGHGVTFNQDNGSTVHASAGEYVASIFDVAHDNGGSTALYAGKSKFDFIDRSWDATNGASDLTGADNGRDKIDFYQMGDSTKNLTTLLARLAASTPTTFSFVHFADPDNAGHDSGFMSAEYLEAVSRVDGYIGQIVDAITMDPDLAGRTVLIVSADHGGRGFGHADRALAANYTVPFFAWGTGVDAGEELYALNPDRRDPGTSQPSYTAPVPPIRTGETANLVADLLGLTPLPGSALNAEGSLSVAREAP